MKPRTDRELLIILRDNIDLLETGLCYLALDCQRELLISKAEEYKIIKYIHNHKPKKTWNTNSYYWQPRLKPPRLRWLNKRIKLLSK